MTDLLELKTARYKGVEFLFDLMTTTGGNRLIKFNFPGSDKQAIERQGKAPRAFTITAIIPHENYFQQRDDLLRVLEDGESGVLTHPTFGDIENVTNGVYTLTEKLTEIGRAQIKIPFEVNDAPGIPNQSENLASQVQEQGSAVNTQLADDLTNTYNVDLNFFGNFSDARLNLTNVATAFTAAAEFAEPLTDNIAGFRQSIRSFSANIGSLIQEPSQLATEINGLFEDLNRLYDSPATLFGAFGLLFLFGDDDPVISPTTVGLQQRKENRDVLRTVMRAEALSFAYLNAAQIDYQTTENLDATQDQLEAQYDDIRTNQTISNAALEQLDVVRVTTQKTLDVVRVNTRTVITVETPRIPLSVLVYSYYGSTELVEVIAELNKVKQNAFVEGELRILTE